MSRYFFNILFILIFSNSLFPQNTATDFTTEDCNSIMHNLYDSLDAGNIIVIAWVMPCGPCSTYAYPAYSAVQSFNISHPEKVDFYLVDDYANTNCASLVNWGNSNNMPLNTTFSSSAISMSDYGSNGMPKVVVLGGSNYNIYYNDNDDKINFNAVQVAINNALSNVTNVNEMRQDYFELFVFPNPSQNQFLNVSYLIQKIEKVSFDILNMLGEIVYSFDNSIPNKIGKHSNTFDVRFLSSGSYLFRISTSSYNQVFNFVIE